MSATEGEWIARKVVAVRKGPLMNVGVDVKNTTPLPGTRKRGLTLSGKIGGLAVASHVMKKVVVASHA
ncbi:hypothetical protein [Prosthecobacter dejongeii]|uniref:Uncharacterized protein n=1 Tax=Prosthecobacter dejongeii TaxID=48465 RepID=A0A7W7YHA6_9BACT|nr:hypothetical protein [Prosthecobacter dejongeii]MBB5036104.1 hypothetical protein [Prosthecobacter dejongeii]